MAGCATRCVAHGCGWPDRAACSTGSGRGSVPETQAQLVAQSEYVQRFWSFESRVPEWDALLTRLALERPRTRLAVEP
jgi:hypothetical protein